MRADADEMDESRIIQSTAWLEHIGGITMELGRVDDTLEVISRLAEPRGIDYSRPVVAHSLVVDAIAETVAVMEELAVGWRDAKIRLAQEQNEARRTILKLPNKAYASLLVCRYVDRMKWDEVGRAIGYDGNYACGYLDKPAKLMLYDYLPPEWKLPKAYK